MNLTLCTRFVYDTPINHIKNVTFVIQTLEGQSIAVARNLTKKVKIGITTLTSYIPESVQITLKDRIDRAKQYSDELIKSFQNVSLFIYESIQNSSNQTKQT